MLLDDWFDTHLHRAIPVAIALIVYGVIFLFLERLPKRRGNEITSADAVSYRTAFLIGLFQILSLIPGTSRSGSTILGAMLLGLSRTAAAEFSFFMAVPTMLGAGGIKVLKFVTDGSAAISGSEWCILAIGCATAFAVSLIVIRYLMDYVRRHSFSAFGVYRIVLGALVIGFLVCTALIAVAYVLKLDPEMIGVGYEKFDIGFLELTVAEAYAPDKWLVLLHTAIILAVSSRLCYDGRRGVGYIREILQPMKEEKPFTGIVSTNLKKLARLSINLGILGNVIILADQIISVFAYDLPGLLIGEKITHVGGLFEVDLGFIVFWAALTLLSYVFAYGEQLQQLDDETL